MLQPGSIANVCDKSGVVLVQCLQVLGHCKKRIAFVGDVVVVSVKRINLRKFRLMKAIKKKKFARGTVHRALLVRSTGQFIRTLGLYVRFTENSVVLVNKNVVPVTNRVTGPILHELCVRHPSLGCISRHII